MIQCPKCGHTTTNANACYCAKCGAKLLDKNVPTATSLATDTSSVVENEDLNPSNIENVTFNSINQEDVATIYNVETDPERPEDNATINQPDNDGLQDGDALTPLLQHDTSDNNIKSLKVKKHGNVAIHTMYIIILIAVSIYSYYQIQLKESMYNSKCSMYNSKCNEIDKLNAEANEMRDEISNKQHTINTLSSVLNKIKDSQPLILGDISFRNSGEDYGNTIYSSNTTYINPKVEIFSLIDETVTIYVKFYTPYGMSTGSSSPYGYSYSDSFSLNRNESNTCTFMGWGGSNKGHWSSGNYRMEFYYKGNCIGSKTFTIY